VAPAHAALEDAVALGDRALVGVVLVDEEPATVPLLDHRSAQLRDSLMRGGLMLSRGCEFCARACRPHRAPRR
jgi:hypothetical protein